MLTNTAAWQAVLYSIHEKMKSTTELMYLKGYLDEYWKYSDDK